MCTDRLDLQDCLEHGRTAKVTYLVHAAVNVFPASSVKLVGDVVTLI